MPTILYTPIPIVSSYLQLGTPIIDVQHQSPIYIHSQWGEMIFEIKYIQTELKQTNRKWINTVKSLKHNYNQIKTDVKRHGLCYLRVGEYEYTHTHIHNMCLLVDLFFLLPLSPNTLRNKLCYSNYSNLYTHI